MSGPSRTGTPPSVARHTISAEGDERGRDATRPSEIPKQGWKDVLLRTKAEVKQDNMSLVAAGVAFYAFLALIPGLVALVSLYGLIADPAEVARQVEDSTAALPRESREFIQSQLQRITTADPQGLGIGLVVGLASAVWSASAGVRAMMTALNVAYDEQEHRKFIRLRAQSLLLTLGAVVLVLAVMGALVVVPAVLDRIGAGGVGRWTVSIGRWPLLLLAVVGSIAVLYRYGPDRQRPQWRWVSWGAVIATVLWLVGTLLFSLYVGNFGSYNETYGTLAGIVLILLWFYLTAFVVLIGAELDAELEHQTARDTTTGPERPLGERGAQMADTIGEPAASGRH